MTALHDELAATRQRFLALVAEVLPELHRYATRMMGSVFDGEDVVQDTLARAWYALAAMDETPPLRPWLFRIAHNTAIDALRRYERRHVSMVEDFSSFADEPLTDSGAVRVEAALEVLMTLPPVQRSAFVLKDVLGHSVDEAAATMGTSVAAVKAALVRARANVASAATPTVPHRDPAELARLRRYASLFNARDWDGLRALFGDETRLDLVARHDRRGKAASEYFTRYAALAPVEGLRAEVGWVGTTPVVAMLRPASSHPAYFLVIDWEDERRDRVQLVRDYRHVPYLAVEASFTQG